MNFAGVIYNGDIAALAVIALGILTTAVCFVTSYRQIRRPRPALVWSCLGLQLLFTTLIFALIYVFYQDEETSSFYNAIREAALAKELETPTSVNMDEVFPSIEDLLSVPTLLLSYAYIAIFMALPTFRNIIHPRLSS